MKTAIVTGGAGFIGSNLVDELINMGMEVYVFDNLSTGNRNNLNPNAKFFDADLTDRATVLNYMASFDHIDYIFHLAALARVQPSIENPLPVHDHNVNATLNILEGTRKYHPNARFVFSSSSSIFGDTEELPTAEDVQKNPMSPYALHKLIGEQYCQLYTKIYGLHTTCLRYFNVYGNRMAEEGAYKLVIAVFKNQYENGEPLNITNTGEQRRDFTHVDDVVQANITSATKPEAKAGEVYNIGHGDNFSVNEVAEMFGGQCVYKESRLEPFETLADNTKARDLLGFNPTGDLKKFIIELKKQCVTT
jgi:nucleoside-diphosphate-sugar epimerase